MLTNSVTNHTRVALTSLLITSWSPSLAHTVWGVSSYSFTANGLHSCYPLHFASLQTRNTIFSDITTSRSTSFFGTMFPMVQLAFHSAAPGYLLVCVHKLPRHLAIPICCSYTMSVSFSFCWSSWPLLQPSWTNSNSASGSCRCSTTVGYHSAVPIFGSVVCEFRLLIWSCNNRPILSPLLERIQ